MGHFKPPNAVGRSNQPRERLEQRLRLFQIARINPLRKPAVNRSRQFARLLRLAASLLRSRRTRGRLKFRRALFFSFAPGNTLGPPYPRRVIPPGMAVPKPPSPISRDNLASA